MYLLKALLVLAFAACCSGDVTKNCPLWTLLNSTSSECECGSDIEDTVLCSNEVSSVSIKNCYCLTYSQELNRSLLSYCIFTCSFAPSHHTYYPMTVKDVADLNNFTCGRFHRTGLMCGDCVEGYAPAVYSYKTGCVPCQDKYTNWLKYIAVAYLPLTIFYIFILLLKISANSASMVAYVTVSQLIAAPMLMRYYYYFDYSYKTKFWINMLFSVYAIWNLDFLRGVYHPFCLHPNYSTLHIICLDYIVGVYPLVLIFITYCLVQLHDRYVIISKLWRPFYTLCSLLRREWNIRESLVKTFATFLILSYVKMMNVSFDILTVAHSYYEVNGSRYRKSYLFVNGSLQYFSKEHVPYAVCAMLMLLVFNIFPFLLLCLYPTSCFQKCLNLFKCRCQILHVFMDAMLGCYRETPHDCRYFAALYIVLRAVNLFLYSITTNPMYFLYSVYALASMAILLAIFRPYKQANRNSIDIIVFALTTVFYSAITAYIENLHVVPIESLHARHVNEPFLVVILCLFPLYGVILAVYQVGKFASKVILPRKFKLFSFLSKDEENSPISSRDECSSLISQ